MGTELLAQPNPTWKLSALREVARVGARGRRGLNRLSELVAGQRGRVVRVEGADDISLRLLEMGLTPGSLVHLLGTAPLGDPLEFEIRGYRLSVRKSEAERVIIESLEANAE